MKNPFEKHSSMRNLLLCVALAGSLALPLPSLAATIALATSPLATSTTTTVKPNMLLVLDNSGSMNWDHMPDDTSDGGSSVPFAYGYYGIRSSQCNEVYYDPAITYLPPLNADKTSFANAPFTAAWTNGFSIGAGTVNLQTGFTANQDGIGGNAGGTDAAGIAYYYNYSGTQTTPIQKNYNTPGNTFYNECNSAKNASPGKDVFTRIVLSNAAATTTATIVVSGSVSTTVSSIKINGVELMSATSTASATAATVAANIAARITLGGYSASSGGTTTVTITGLAATASSLIITQSGTMTLDPTIYQAADVTKQQNFANWYSYYRTRMLMMKTATGRAFGNVDNNYRVGLMKISASTAPTVPLGVFETTQRSNWYTALYATTVSGSTPLRTALSNAGRYYAGLLAGVTDPIEYSCQQNFALMSTDGYWNSGNDMKLDGSTAVGNQDGTAARPMYDGAQASTTTTTTYTRNNYSTSATGLGADANCANPKKRLLNQPQTQSCTVTGVAAPVCTAWANSGAKVYVAPYTSAIASCASPVLPNPNPSNAVATGSVTTPGSTGGSSSSLADVAMYYYQTDLRTTALGNCTSGSGTGATLCSNSVPDPYNNVFISSTDDNIQQHMTTFTLGLGASGWMTYSSSYLNDTSGDYFSVKTGQVANSAAIPPICSWQANGSICNWPMPGMSGSDGLIANIDDLWHAAVDGHGAYFSATNPTTLSQGLASALAGIKARKGAAAAAATSTLNPIAGNNFAYVASYTTVAWKGNLEARGINIDTGVVSQNATWCVESVPADTCVSPGTVVADTSGATTVYNCVTPGAAICTGGTLVGTDCLIPLATACTGTMVSKVTDISDTRTILTPNSSGNGLINFDAAFASGNANFSPAKQSVLSQWATLTVAQQGNATDVALVNYLRGRYGNENRTGNPASQQLYRTREAVMGDALESQPIFVANPVFQYTYPGYVDFKAAQANRPETVYMGANDGMLHAFDAASGVERWAYVPSMVIPNMWQLADFNYATKHVNFINGSPNIGDIFDSASGSWKTILVSGLNGGGRGYFALDITNPSSPILLWEFTPTTGIGAIKDDDLGYSFAQPQITRKADGTWVVLVTSGYNNVSPGTGVGYLFVLNAKTGAIISKISTAVGNAGTPSGLAKVSVWNDDPAGNQAGYVYGGDLLGNLFRFDINNAAPAAFGTGTVMTFVQFGATQPITTAPVLGDINGKRVVFIGTGKYLEPSDLNTVTVQSEYAIQDDNVAFTLTNPRAQLVKQTLANNAGAATRNITGSVVDWSTGRGWYFDFPDSGERVNIDALLIQGVLVIPSLVPSSTICTPGGYGWLNFVDYNTGLYVHGLDIAGTKYDSTIVGINEIIVQGKAKVAVVTSADPTPEISSKLNIQQPPPSFQGKRFLWREL